MNSMILRPTLGCKKQMKNLQALKSRSVSAAITILATLIPLALGRIATGEQPIEVRTIRVPEQGIQPHVVVDDKGVVHMIFFRGDPMNGDIFYVRSTSSGVTFSKPIRVNSQPKSAIATGTIRGAQMALGKNGRVHVSWMGSGEAEPRAPSNQAPMLYSRLNDAGTEFEPQRNVIQFAYGLDGGGSVAADALGNVYVAWHAGAGEKGEDKRRIFVACSKDDGKTFAREKPASDKPTGACGCCGMKTFADAKGLLYILYRAANPSAQGPIDNREMYLLLSKNQGSSFQGLSIHPWKINQCVMSLCGFYEAAGHTLTAWETKEQVYYAEINPATSRISEPIAAPGSGGRKYPVVARNASGETILVWTEGMGWQRGGAVAWQVFDKEGKPTPKKGRKDGVPVWSLVAVFSGPDQNFIIVY